MSNWASWIEILWLAFRSVLSRFHPYGTLMASGRSLDPIFVLPLSNDPVLQRDMPLEVRATGRRTGTGSAAISLPTKSVAQRANIIGFRKVSLLHIIMRTGNTPLDVSSGNYSSLEEIRSSANRPVVVFPECTTSNGRGLLKFADIFKDRQVPVKGYNVFIMCARCVKRACVVPSELDGKTVLRYDPPTALSPTLSNSIPLPLNPLPHIFSLTRTLQPLTMSIRLLPPAESPSSPSFLLGEVVSSDVGDDILGVACSGLISQLGKLKRMNLSWEDKVLFLKLYREKRG